MKQTKLNHSPLQPNRAAMAAWIATAFLTVPVSAQEAETVFQLSPFEVNASNDRGYTATSSLAGGRLSSDLRDTAAAVTVMTTEFLADIGATNFLDAAKWAPNAIPVQEVSGADLYNDYSVQFRSLGAGFQSRNYFRWYINSDAYNTARIEFARGPNSLVFGDAGVGGIANVSSLQATGSGITNLQVQLNSFGGYRATFDHDMRITENLSLRAAGVYQRFDDWRDVGVNDRDGLFLTATYQFSPRTSVRAEVEWGQSNRLISFGILENFSGWDGVTFVDARLNPGNFGVFRRNNADRLVYISANPDAGIVNWLGYGATFGTFRMLTTQAQPGLPADMLLDSYKRSFQAPNAGAQNPYFTASAFFQHQFGTNLFFELAANYQEQRREVKRWFFDALEVDINRNLPDGRPNPNVGQLFGDARFWEETQKNEVFDIRASLAYLWETAVAENRFLAVAGHRDDRFERSQDEWVRTNGSDPRVNSAANRIFARRYESDLAQSVLMPPALDPVSGIESRMARTGANFSQKPITYLQGAVIGKWFRDRRLNTMAGARFDQYKEVINNRDTDVYDPVTREFLQFGRDETTVKDSVTSFNLSSVYHLTQQFSLFAGYSESFDPGSTAIGINGDSLPALISNGVEGGIKMQLWDGRMVGSITYYRNEQENARMNGESGTINNLWGLLQMQDRQVANYRDRQSFKGTGVEFDFTAMPTPNWRLLFNISFPDTELTDGLVDTRRYFDDNVTLWRSELARLEAAGETLLADAVANAISRIETNLAGVETGRRLNDTFRYTANVFTRYFFSEGIIEGLSIGGGANFRGERLVGNRPGDAFDYIYADDYVLFTFVMGYDFSVRDTMVSVQLNVSNLFDKEIVRPTRYGSYRAGSENFFVPDRFHVQDPRRILLTVSAAF